MVRVYTCVEKNLEGKNGIEGDDCATLSKVLGATLRAVEKGLYTEHDLWLWHLLFL